MEVNRNDGFTLTWIIQNFSMCHLSKEECFPSPEFALNSLPGKKWYIGLYLKCKEDGNYICVAVYRTDNSDKCNIEYRYQLLDCNGDIIFSSEHFIAVFLDNKVFYVHSCTEENFLLGSLINDILIIKCTLKSVFECNEQELLPLFPYTNGLFTDVVLRAGGKSFSVHKAILWARWPEMAKKLEAKNSEIHLDVEPNMLETIIKYIYTGEMDFNKHESLDIYAAAVKCEISSLSSLPIVAMTARTHINVKKISFEWPIGKLSRLPVHTELQSHVFAAHGTSEWSLIFNIRMDAKTGKLFKISLCRKNCLFSMKPVFVRTKISLDKFSKTYLAEGEHMFKSFENWVCAEFPGGMDSEELEDVLLLKCEFKFADWKYSTHVEEIEHAFVSPIINHFRADLRNLYKGGKVSDIDIAVGSRIFPAHKFILCARSSVFFRIFEAKRKKWKSSIFTISDVDPEVMDEMLLFMYSGNLEKPLEETAMKLYAAADKYDVVALKQKCLFFLKSNTTVQNVCSVLQLSHMYNDDEWHKAALEFFAAHVAEVLSTDEWKKIPKDNFWFKILENVIVKNIPTEKAVPDVDRKVKQS